MTSYPFLSPEWVEEARAVQREFSDRLSPPSESVRMNVTVTGAPFTDGTVLGHVDTTSGSAIPALGHLESPDVAIRVPYDVARQMLIEQQFEHLMIAFMTGDIEVEGDITMVMALQDLEPSPEQQALADQVIDRLRGITA